MPIARFTTAALAIAGLTLSPAYAAGQKGKGPGATTHGPAARTQTPHSVPQTPTTHGNPHTTTTKASPPTTTTKAHGNPHTTSQGAGGATATAASTPAPTTTLNPIAQKLRDKPLGTRLAQMLAPSGLTLNAASDGFRNQGQFIAAVHVSQNLGIPFAALKAAMLGTPLPGTTTATTSPMSLGQAIQQLKPFANATTEAARAEKQSASDLQTVTASIPSTTTKRKTRGK